MTIGQRLSVLNQPPPRSVGMLRSVLCAAVLIFAAGPLIAPSALSTLSVSASTSVKAVMPTPRDLLNALIPVPLSVTPGTGSFNLSADTTLFVPSGDPAVASVAQLLADSLRPATGYALPVSDHDATAQQSNIHLHLTANDSTLGTEGYTLTIAADDVTLSADTAAGLFYGVQTLRQLLPAAIDSSSRQDGPWQIAAATIRDVPRFGWRGAMLDVARHFFGVADIKRYIDLMVRYKLNRLHLHLSDDQGWRIAIDAWPKLATYGGSTAVNGDPGGYYTQADYRDIVAYAQQRFVTIVPEIDMPGHTNAALASYPELNCNDTAPDLYTGIKVGFSTLCVGKDITYQFIDTVVAEIVALTPGPYFHIGGDESAATAPADYITFVERVQAIVQAHGKQIVGWEEVSQARLLPTTLVQQWANDMVIKAVQQGAKAIMSPAKHAYLDMKYDAETPLGLNWAGYVSVQQAYDWDPVELFAGINESDIAGVEAPLWSETLRTFADVEQMAFPRLIGIAEIGWSAAAARQWNTYHVRLAAQYPRLDVLGVNYYRTP